MIQREQQIIRTAIIALLVVLALMYLLIYSTYYRSRSSNASDTQTGSDSPQKMQSVTQQLINTVQEVITTVTTLETGSTSTTQVVISKDTPSSGASSPTTISPGSSGLSAVDILTASVNSTNQEKILPGTSPTTERTIADDIGVDYRYALRDTRGIYYLNLGLSTQDL